MERRLTPSYNCAHFVVDAWYDETGQDIAGCLGTVLRRPAAMEAKPPMRHEFTRLPAPTAPCLVLLRRARLTPHVGMFVRGKVFHLTDHGPVRQLLDIARVGYTSVRYYAPRPFDHRPV